MRRTHKPRNINDQISTREIQSRELRATLLGNQPDWKPTHETTYQHTRRRCDGRRMDRRARAGFATRRRAKRDRQVSRADGPSDAQNNAEAAAPVTGRDTRYGPLHPLRGATPVTGRDTRSEEVHCLRIGCSAPNHKNKRGICETIADTPPTRWRHVGGQLLMLQTSTAQFKTVAQGANLDGPIGERTGRPGRGCRGCRENGK